MSAVHAILKSRYTRLLLICAAAVTLFLFRSAWWPVLNSFAVGIIARPTGVSGHDHAPDEHDHAHAGHSDHESLELSPQAMKNLGLTAEYLSPISTTTWYKTISIPALIVELPGRSVIQVSNPMTGVVTHISAVPGSAVEPGTPLFQIRLTHEELVTSQTEFVRALGERDVEEKEMKRLQAGVDSGVIPPKSVLEREYAKERLEALLGAQREALRLHGLSARQVAMIEKDRRLLSELSVVAPSRDQKQDELKLSGRGDHQPVSLKVDEPGGDETADVPLIIESLNVQRGQSIEQGGRLCSLADDSRLYIEGRAFEQDAAAIGRTAGRDWKVRALLSDGEILDSLPIAYVASEIDEESRTLKFYVDLTNEIVRDHLDADGNRFVSWKYKPGQRLQLLIPVEEWKDQIVLPTGAVAQEGPESYVFQQNGNHFDRVSVHVIHRDQSHVVIANDGSLFPGDIVALRNAHQMQMEVRNQAGGGIDPHAGHTH